MQINLPPWRGKESAGTGNSIYEEKQIVKKAINGKSPIPLNTANYFL